MAGGEWEYPLVEEAMKSSGIHPIELYVKWRQSIIEDRVACRPIYVLCTKLERMTGMSRLVRWWDQDAINEPED